MAKFSVLFEECSTTSQQHLAVADAKTGAAAKPIGRRRIRAAFSSS
jgi:hypothetical protein